MNGLHQALLDAKGVVKHLDQRNKAVGGATGIADDLLSLEVEILMVDAIDKRCICAVAWSRHNDQRSATNHVVRSRLASREEAGGFDHHVDTQVAPWQILGIALAENLQNITVDRDATLDCLDGVRQLPKHRVVLQQVSHLLKRSKVVDSNKVDVDTSLFRGAEEVAADTTKAIDTNTNSHEKKPFESCADRLAVVGHQACCSLGKLNKTFYLERSRCPVRTATPRSRNRLAISSATATLRCLPPVHPIATVR